MVRQWVGEEKIKEYAPQLQTVAAQEPTNRRLFLAVLAANHLLSGGKPNAEPADEKLLVSVLQEEKQLPTFRVLAMQALKPEHAALSAENLGKFLEGKEPALRRAALRVLSLRGDKKAEPLLLKAAGDTGLGRDQRAEAVLGLAAFADTAADVQTSLAALLNNPELRFDALRSLRPAARSPEGAAKLLAWYDRNARRQGPHRRDRR
jgi:HEAT repeat protein